MLCSLGLVSFMLSSHWIPSRPLPLSQSPPRPLYPQFVIARLLGSRGDLPVRPAKDP